MCDRFLKSRHDADDNTISNYRSTLNGFCERFDGHDLHELTASDIAEWVAELAAKQKPGTVRQKVIAVRLLLDFAGVDPNPARDPRGAAAQTCAERTRPTIGRACSGDPRRPRQEMAADVRHDRTGRAESGGGCQFEVGRRRRGRATAAAATVRNETRPGAVGLSARVADAGDRRDLSARGSRP